MKGCRVLTDYLNKPKTAEGFATGRSREPVACMHKFTSQHPGLKSNPTPL